jgi:inosine-uridine nucleoside N-ribohydrolase
MHHVARAWLLALHLTALVAPCGAAPEDVWLDVDCAIGLPGADVDDGLALIQAFRSPELAVRGVSTVHGNAALAPGLPVTRELMARFGPRGMAIADGAAYASQLGAALAERPLTLLALGPLTNVGTLLMRHRELAPRIRRVVIVAGRRPGQEFFSSKKQKEPFRDFNFELDPEAARVLVESGVPLVLAPWEVSSHVWITPADLDALARRGADGAWLALRCAPWMELWLEKLGAHGFNPFDMLAVAWVTHPGLVETMPVDVTIERREKPYLVCRPARGAARALSAVRPRPELHALLLDRLISR